MSAVIGFTTSDYLMLDVDNKTKTKVCLWTMSYSKRYHLGCALINITSDTGQVDLLGHRLYNFSIIFGEHLPWQEIMLHIRNALRDGMVDKKFVKMRFQGFITERVSAKNSRKGHPRIFHYIRNGNKGRHKEGVFEYLRWWKWNRDLGNV